MDVSPLHREARRLAAQLEAALHDPAADEETFHRMIDRYAEVLGILRRAASPPPDATDRPDHPDRPVVGLVLAFVGVCMVLISVLYAW